MAGTWTGGGTIDLTNDIQEKLRCRATYTYNQASNGLALAIRCASDNYKFELTSNVVERNGQISGQWSETAYGVSGSISGRVNGGRISAVAKGDSFTAALSVNTNGNRQSVTITPQATYIINVQIGLGKAAPRQPRANASALRCASISAITRRSSDASGPSPSRQRARSPALPACSSVGRGGADALGADRLRRTLELVRGGGQRREVAVARGAVDLALGLDRGVAEFAEQRIDRGLVVAEPGAEHAAVDRAAAGRAVRWRHDRCRRDRPRASAPAWCAAARCSPA